MNDDSATYEVEGSDITIHVDGRVRRSPLPVGFEPRTFRDAVATADILYRDNGVFPSIKEVSDYWPKISKKTYEKIFSTSEFRQALELRGVSVEESPGLSPEQSTAISVLTHPDGRAQTTKLKQLGISQQKFHAWMRSPLFAETLRRRQEQVLGDSVPMLLNALISNAEKGDQRAIEKGLEITGRYNPAQIEVQNAKDVVAILIESIVRHVASKEVVDAILGDVDSAMRKMHIISGTKQPKELA